MTVKAVTGALAMYTAEESGMMPQTIYRATEARRHRRD